MPAVVCAFALKSVKGSDMPGDGEIRAKVRTARRSGRVVGLEPERGLDRDAPPDHGDHGSAG